MEVCIRGTGKVGRGRGRGSGYAKALRNRACQRDLFPFVYLCVLCIPVHAF